MTIGFIGLGAMGNPMAANLLKNNDTVKVFDMNPAAVVTLVEKGAIAAQDIPSLADGCDVVLTSLPNGAIVEGVMLGDNGVIKHINSGGLIIDLSSVAPETSKKMAKEASAYEVDYMDSPVSGGVAGAVAGTLTFMVGASEAGYAKGLPVLEAMGKNIFHVGEVGSGDAMKIVNNLLLGCNMAALSESLNLGLKCGLDLETMYNILKISSGRSYALEAKMEPFIMAGKLDGGFAINLQHKDLGLALEAGKDTITPTPMTAAATQVFGLAKSMDYGTNDISSLVSMWQEICN